jgi:O-antigen ligase
LFSAQSALTFSRSGLYMSGLSVLAAVISTAKSARLRNAYILTGIVLYIVGSFVVFPVLNNFTGGALEARFSNTNVTGRDMLMKSDLDVFQRHPFLGVGPGMAIANRGITFQAIAAHSEITRTLAEHGMLGLCALIILCAGIWRRIASVRDVKIRGLFIATASFGILCMLSNAMRIVAPAFMIGLIFAAERPVERIAHRR